MQQDAPEYKPVSELDFFRDNFFRTEDGNTALVKPEDLLKAIRDHPTDDLNPATMEAKDHYWLHKPYSYAVIVYSHSESEYQYWCVEPHLSHAERKQMGYLEEKVRTVAEDQEVLQAGDDELGELIQSILFDLVKRYDLADEDVLDQTAEVAEFQPAKTVSDDEEDIGGWRDKMMTYLSGWLESMSTKRQAGGDIEEQEGGNFTVTYSPQQVDKITYYLIRDIVGRDKINPLANDFSVEDISCDGYNEPVFVHHTNYEEMWTNIYFRGDKLDDFIKHLAQSSGKGISKRDPIANVELDDGSRANLTLGTEVTTKGSNFTIRQFKPVPFTPVDLINWETYSLEQMAYLWQAIEFGKNAIFAGGTASGKTTTLNAVSLFIPSKTKIVSIEDTPELELPHKNWVQSETRSGGRGGGRDAYEEFDLLKASFRQRPSYIVLGEVRGDEGLTLFQAMSSGHTAFTTFHANNANELVQRFTGDQIGVDAPAFEQLDLVCNQEQVRVDGSQVRRSTEIKEVIGYNDETDDVEFRDMYSWVPSEDEFDAAESSTVMSDIREKNGWNNVEFQREFIKRKAVLAYLVREGYSDYSEVAGTIQAFMNDPDTILHYIATDQLGEYLEQLRTMKSIEIQVDPEVEDLVNRPRPSAEVLDEAKATLDTAEDVLQEYRHMDIGHAFREAQNPFEEDQSILDFSEDPERDTDKDPSEGDTGSEPPEVDNESPADVGDETTAEEGRPSIDQPAGIEDDTRTPPEGAEASGDPISPEEGGTAGTESADPESPVSDISEEEDDDHSFSAAEVIPPANEDSGIESEVQVEPDPREQGGGEDQQTSRTNVNEYPGESESEPDESDRSEASVDETSIEPGPGEIGSDRVDRGDGPPVSDSDGEEHTVVFDPQEEGGEAAHGSSDNGDGFGPPPASLDEDGGTRNSDDTDMGESDSRHPEKTEAEETLDNLTPPVEHSDGDGQEKMNGEDDHDELRTGVELYVEEKGVDPVDFPLQFDWNDCHYIIGENDDDDRGLRQCGTPVGDDSKLCHFHQDKNQDLADVEAAIASAIIDEGSE